MLYKFTPKGVCSREINIEVENGVIKSLNFVGGCEGNLKGISALCIGKKTQEIINILDGIHCGNKATSCPDQLAKALRQI